MKADLVKMLKEFFEEQGYDVEGIEPYFYVSNDDTDSQLSFEKSKIEDFLQKIYHMGHDVGYSKGLKTMRHIQATMKEKRNGIP